MMQLLSLLSPKRLALTAITGIFIYFAYKLVNTAQDYIALQQQRQQSYESLIGDIEQLRSNNVALFTSLESAQLMNAKLIESMQKNERALASFLQEKDSRAASIQEQISTLKTIAKGSKNEDCINLNLPDDVIRLLNHSATSERKNSNEDGVCSSANSSLDDSASRSEKRCNSNVERRNRTVTKLQRETFRM